jgi:hypothetical protein
VYISAFTNIIPTFIVLPASRDKEDEANQGLMRASCSRWRLFSRKSLNLMPEKVWNRLYLRVYG